MIKNLLVIIVVVSYNFLYAADFVPSVDISLYGGKYYLDKRSSSLDLKTDIFSSFVINFNEENQIYPVYSFYYNGTQDIQELAGGDVLTRQRMGHSFILKYKHSKDFN